jgi:hypothetical protein
MPGREDHEPSIRRTPKPAPGDGACEERGEQAGDTGLGSGRQGVAEQRDPAANQGPASRGRLSLRVWLRRRHCCGVNVPCETTIRAAAAGEAASGRHEAQSQVAELLRDVVRGFRRQHVQLAAGGQFPFPVYGPSLAAVREISEHPGITVNELARLTGLPPC